MCNSSSPWFLTYFFCNAAREQVEHIGILKSRTRRETRIASGAGPIGHRQPVKMDVGQQSIDLLAGKVFVWPRMRSAGQADMGGNLRCPKINNLIQEYAGVVHLRVGQKFPGGRRRRSGRVPGANGLREAEQQ